ncbi:MAG: class I SAM-dependent DNA methyltransferase, partial [Proteobacteria bacterium]|nr:class I SAM-dependent DNA methyltransferase [Pseudomonadota bacterium]
MEKLNENEIWLRADAFSKNWKDARYEKAESQSFYNAFFKIFGLKRHQVARFEDHVEKLDKSHGYIDLLWPGVLIVEQKSRGKNLDEAVKQVKEYTDALPIIQRPHYQLVCDFQKFRLLDINRRKEINFTLAELPDKIDAFDFMLDKGATFYEEQKKLSIDASEMMGEIHKDLSKSGYDEKHLEILLTRLTFCLFADNTGIFERRLFQKLILDTREDGKNTGERIAKIFEVLDTPEHKRQDHLESKLAKLRYVNGRLFEKIIPSADFNERIRFNLYEAGKFDWKGISPAIFGSMFQSVMNKNERREQGAHYTNEKDILKVINPLFMDDFRDEFERIRKRKTAEERHALLKPFQDRLAELKFFDPACGCGNFLVITYRELRRLEIEILELLHTDSNGKINRNVDINTLSKIDVDQFYGIELNNFAAHIARSALWMMDHFMNRELSKVFGEPLLRFPLEKSPTIKQGDALEMDWTDVLQAKYCNFIFGNPPFGGPSYQSKKQREQMRILTNPEGKGATPLDYVGAWFLKSAAYVRTTKKNISFAFVATNSITQGEQVALLWEPLLHEYKLEIAFAHQTFVWESEASGRAQVHVVIIGLEKQEHARDNRMLFSYKEPKSDPIGKSVFAISPYLFDATKLGNLANPNLIIHGDSNPISKRPMMTRGPQPTDGGNYILREGEIEDFLGNQRIAEKFMHDFIGAKELIHGKRRKILDLEGIEPNELKKMPTVQERIKKVIEFRKKSTSKETREMAKYPTQFLSRRIPQKSFLIIPRVSSEYREYIPMAYAEPPTIPSDAVIYLEGDNTLCMLSILSSSMHMAWVRTVAGRLKSDFRYSNTIVYNTFPLPKEEDLETLAPFGQAILDARAKSPDTTLATHYKPDNLLPELRKA